MAGDRPSRTDEMLKSDTLRYYWPEAKKNADKALTWYVDNLLPHELAWACYKNGVPEPDKRTPCDVLVCLVGFSLDPLLQSVCVYNPRQKIVLILNEFYGEVSEGSHQRVSGASQGERVQDLIERLLANKTLRQTWLTYNPSVIPHVLPSEDPDAVFRTLHATLLEDQQAERKIVVDITGGKKNMDAGAFLFAAYTGATVSYVNFELYHEKERRPFGYTCRIQPIERNPYDAFRLRDWEELRQDYEEYRFDAALAILDGIEKPMIETFSGGKNGVDVACPLQLLREVLEFYQAWELGDYEEARARYDVLLSHMSTFPALQAVSDLGEAWSDIRSHTESIVREGGGGRQRAKLALAYEPIYASEHKLLSYADDELARIERLITKHHDYRSALLRAAGLDEFLIKARLVRSWLCNDYIIMPTHLIDWDVSRLSYAAKTQIVQDNLKRLKEALFTHSAADAMRESQYPESTLGLRLYRDRIFDSFAVTFVNPWDLGFYSSCTLTADALTQLRNQAIHAYLCVDRELARQAVEVASANVEDLRAALSVAPSGPGAVERIEWSDLCARCGLTFLPGVALK